MKKILVPCDFSKPAINAYRLALDVAQQSRGVIHLLHVIELPVLHDTVLMPVLSFEEEFLKELRLNAETRFKKIAEKYKGDGVRVIVKTEFGAVSRMIQDYVTKEKIDIVIMGSHGASGFREYFVGSNAEKMVRQSPVPVLVIKDYYKGAIKNIVFPSNLEQKKQDDLILKVKDLQSFFKARLHIVWINTPGNFVSDRITLRRLNDFATKFDLKDYTLNIYNDIDEEEGIIHFSSLIKADLIAMGSHGRKGLGRLLSNPSISEDVVNHNKGLVWTYSLKKSAG